MLQNGHTHGHTPAAWLWLAACSCALCGVPAGSRLSGVEREYCYLLVHESDLMSSLCVCVSRRESPRLHASVNVAWPLRVAFFLCAHFPYSYFLSDSRGRLLASARAANGLALKYWEYHVLIIDNFTGGSLYIAYRIEVN